jgi:D-alanine-D-alanine ligase
MTTTRQKAAPATTSKKKRQPARSRRPQLAVDTAAMKKLKLVAVAYSHVEREWFPTEEAYKAEAEVEDRAREVVEELQKLGIEAKGYPGDQYFLTNLLVDRPDLVLNLVDTLRGNDALSTSVPAALELASIPYTGAGMEGLVIGNDRNLFKQLLLANDIPTPPFQYITRRNKSIEQEVGLPLIVKLNASGGSVGIDNNAVKESFEDAQARVNELLETYRVPVIVEQFIDGSEMTVVVFDDGQKKHVFVAEKQFGKKPDGKHSFTSIESYNDPASYKLACPADDKLAARVAKLASKAFVVLKNRDYAKFDVRIDKETGETYFTDCNPNTAFGPHSGLPFTEVLALYGIPFSEALASLMSKHAKRIERERGTSGS